MPILGIIASQNYVRIPPTSYESIATVTVGSGGSSTVTFSSIPSTYTHLQLRAIARCNRSGLGQAGCRIRFNSDTGSNYAFHQLYGNGSLAGSEGYSSQTEMNLGELPAATAPANTFGVVLLDILDYANTDKYKVMREIGANDRNGAGQIGYNSGLWLNTNAITSITLFETVSSWIEYSSFALYGIKG